ncbi:MAG: protein kinase [Clostridia bacterium]|nr:protein kinase [Clostridia bacterium]
MSEFRRECESSFYRELYHVEGKNQRILLNAVTGRQYLEKTLDVYDIRVYEYLRTHRDIHIPAVESYTERDGKLVVLEDYVNGETLTAYLARGIPDAERRRIVLELCDALTFLHSAAPPIIHRDLKTDNVIITPEGVVKLIDYDAATVFDPTKSADTVLMGTPGAAAPEQYGFARSDARTDIYALGVLIRQLLPQDKNYLAAADRATRMDPDDRWSSAEEMKQALCGAQQKDGKQVVLKKLLKKKRFWIAASAVVVCVLFFSVLKESGKILEKTFERNAFSVSENAESVTEADNKEKQSSANPAIREKIKNEVDAYEAFVDEYCSFMKSYKNGDNTANMLSSYTEIMKKYNDWLKKINLLKTDLSPDELIYYNEAMLRCIKRLNEVN